MDNNKKRFPDVLYIILSSVALLIWLVFIFFALFLGGSYGPSHERSVPHIYAGIISLGFLGAILGINAGIKGLGAKPVRKALPLCAATLGVIGSVPFFLLDLPAVGLFALLLGVLPTILYMSMTKKRLNV